MTRVTLAIGFLLVASAAGAQSASIRGTVRDSSSRPMLNSDVVVEPIGRHFRTDSAGHFSFESLEPGQYTVRARRVGYEPGSWTVDLSKGGHVEIQLVLGSRIASLDTVFVFEPGRPCEPQTYEGFMCRRAGAKGRFLDYADIDTIGVVYSADLLRDIGGFTSIVRSTHFGPTRMASSKHCTIVLMNGVASSWSTIPESPADIIGIEIYQTPSEIPKEYRRYTWGKEDCWLVAYWTASFLRPIGRVSVPRP
jgi:hypothetical protein